MADNLTAQSSAPATPPASTIYRSYFDGTEHHLPGVCEYVSGGSAGAWTIQQVDATHGLPTNLYAVGGVAFNIGQQTSSNSLSVVVASDQGAFPTDPGSGGGNITAADVGSTSTTNAAGQVIVTGSPTASSSIQSNLTGENAVFVRVLGIFNATLAFERSSDNGTNWVAVAAEELSLGTAVTSFAFSDNNTYLFRANVAGQTNFRVRCTARSSGTAAVNIQPTYRQPMMAVAQVGGPWLSTIQQGGNSATVTAGNALKVDGSAVTQPVNGTVTANAGTGTFNIQSNASVNLAQVAGSAVALGQTTMSASIPVAIASDQSHIPVQGDVASGSSDSGNPVKIGGIANGSAPGAVSASQRVQAWFGLVGQQMVATLGGNISTQGNGTPQGMIGTNSAAAQTLAVATFIHNGQASNFGDMQRSNTDLSLLASATHTTAQQSPDQTNYNGRGVKVVLNVSVASGTGGLQVQIQGKDSISGNYYQLNANPTAITGTGTFIYDLYPTGGTAAQPANSQFTNSVLPRTWRVNVAVGDASSYTYSISGVTIL